MNLIKLFLKYSILVTVLSSCNVQEDVRPHSSNPLPSQSLYSETVQIYDSTGTYYATYKVEAKEKESVESIISAFENNIIVVYPNIPEAMAAPDTSVPQIFESKNPNEQYDTLPNVYITEIDKNIGNNKGYSFCLKDDLNKKRTNGLILESHFTITFAWPNPAFVGIKNLWHNNVSVIIRYFYNEQWHLYNYQHIIHPNMQTNFNSYVYYSTPKVFFIIPSYVDGSSPINNKLEVFVWQ